MISFRFSKQFSLLENNCVPPTPTPLDYLEYECSTHNAYFVPLSLTAWKPRNLSDMWLPLVCVLFKLRGVHVLTSNLCVLTKYEPVYTLCMYVCMYLLMGICTYYVSYLCTYVCVYFQTTISLIREWGCWWLLCPSKMSHLIEDKDCWDCLWRCVCVCVCVCVGVWVWVWVCVGVWVCLCACACIHTYVSVVCVDI